MGSEKWYKGGLHFACMECGNCCTGEPGYVWVTRQEIRRIAAFLGHNQGWLSKDQLRRIGFKYSLTERPNGDCIFMQKNANGKRVCSIYSVRPLQCRTWPFWTSNLKSTNSWAEASLKCPGMNNGKQYNFCQIEELRLKKSW
ncbi:MAG: YkgJ family cysteine cluster protein [Planctomycetota bacterium]|nr:MAG: YkgJ family cysteine cluster protein [Planctomycetota bacterium]